MAATATVIAPARRPRPVGAGAPHRRSGEATAQPRLRVVDDARLRAAHRRRRMRLVIFAAAVVTTASLFALAAFNAVLVTGQGRLDELQGQVAEAQSRYSANRLRVAKLESPEHVVQVAQQRLGMVPPQEVRYLSPSEAMADEVGAGTRATGPSAGREDGGTSWAAAKPYLSSRP